jgi:hypothetical protein
MFDFIFNGVPHEICARWFHVPMLERVVHISMSPPSLMISRTASLHSSSSTLRWSLAKTRAVRFAAEEGARRREKPMRAMIKL